MTAALDLGFAGTPDFAVRILRALHESPHRVAAVFTQPDRPAGRRRRLTPSPTRRFAEAHGLPVHTPERIGAELPRIRTLDVLVVAAYGLILPAAVLDAPARGCLNVHASLLPRWRGAAPVERAIMAGDTTTGVSIMRIDTGLDTGPVLARRATPIRAPTETGAALTERLADLGAREMLDCLARLDELEPIPQDPAGATQAPKLTARDAVIDWTRPAADIALAGPGARRAPVRVRHPGRRAHRHPRGTGHGGHRVHARQARTDRRGVRGRLRRRGPCCSRRCSSRAARDARSPPRPRRTGSRGSSRRASSSMCP